MTHLQNGDDQRAGTPPQPLQPGLYVVATPLVTLAISPCVRNGFQPLSPASPARTPRVTRELLRFAGYCSAYARIGARAQ